MSTLENFNRLNAGQTERLALLAEELGETVQSIGKILRHGYDSGHPDDHRFSNRQELENELGDIEAAKVLLFAAGDLSLSRVNKARDKKLNKPERYLHHQTPEISRPPIYIVVAGSRSYNDYDDFSKKLEAYLKRHKKSHFVIVSGAAARGADAMAIRWCEENNVPYVTYPADWDTHGKAAGYIRNSEMGEIATHVVAYWDMESRGTQHMIDLAIEKEIPCIVFAVQPDKPTN